MSSSTTLRDRYAPRQSTSRRSSFAFKKRKTTVVHTVTNNHLTYFSSMRKCVQTSVSEIDLLVWTLCFADMQFQGNANETHP